MKPVTLYTTQSCPYCIQAKMLLKQKGVGYIEISVDGDRERRQEMEQRSGRQTVPQIWIGEQHIGGYDELYQLEQLRRLDCVLAK